MKEKISQNAWILKEKELLEKLSLEISRDFSIWKELSLKLINKTNLSLSELKYEINNSEFKSNKLDVLKTNDNNLNKEELDKLFSVLDWVRKIIEEASRNEIKELKDILDNNDISSFVDDNELIKKIFPKKILLRAKKPKNIPGQLIWVTLGITNSVIWITWLLYFLWKGIITSIPDLITLLTWKWKIENFKNM